MNNQIIRQFTFSDLKSLSEADTRTLLLNVSPEVFAKALKILDKEVLNHLKNSARNGNSESKMQFINIAQEIKYRPFVSKEEALYCRKEILFKMEALLKNGEIFLPKDFSFPDMSSFPNSQVPEPSNNFHTIYFEDFLSKCPLEYLHELSDQFSDEDFATALCFCSNRNSAVKRFFCDEERQNRVLEIYENLNKSAPDFYRRVESAQSKILALYRWRYENEDNKSA